MFGDTFLEHLVTVDGKWMVVDKVCLIPSSARTGAKR